MYSPLIVDKHLTVAKKKYPWKRRHVWEIEEFKAHIAKRLNPATGEINLTAAQREIITSEATICRFDFRYWVERYGSIEIDPMEGGGVGRPKLWASQERALEIIGKRQEECLAQYEKHGFSEGILVLWHKARQLGATGLMRLICGHRMTNYKNVRLVAASLDESKVHELYVRDKIIIDNLPSYMRPKIEFDVKDQHISFENLKSRLVYQQANQQAGIGTGSQFDIFHFTELAMWAFADRLKFDFFPTIPKSPYVFGGAESTANGRGNFWHEFTEAVRNHEYGYESWVYIFTPYYIEPTKYRRAAPDDWRPMQIVIDHAEMVERTSPDIIGRLYRLTRDQMYWWETEHEMYRKDGSLNIFLTNYCATPEESFQHSSISALPIETIEWMRTTSLKGMPYLPIDLNTRA